jgi:hypothetical protein
VLNELLPHFSAPQRQQLLQLQLAHWKQAAELGAAVQQKLQAHGRSQSQVDKLSDAALDAGSAYFCLGLLAGRSPANGKSWVSC